MDVLCDLLQSFGLRYVTEDFLTNEGTRGLWKLVEDVSVLPYHSYRAPKSSSSSTTTNPHLSPQTPPSGFALLLATSLRYPRLKTLDRVVAFHNTAMNDVKTRTRAPETHNHNPSRDLKSSLIPPSTRDVLAYLCFLVDKLNLFEEYHRRICIDSPPVPPYPRDLMHIPLPNPESYAQALAARESALSSSSSSPHPTSDQALQLFTMLERVKKRSEGLREEKQKREEEWARLVNEEVSPYEAYVVSQGPLFNAHRRAMVDHREAQFWAWASETVMLSSMDSHTDDKKIPDRVLAEEEEETGRPSGKQKQQKQQQQQQQQSEGETKKRVRDVALRGLPQREECEEMFRSTHTPVWARPLDIVFGMELGGGDSQPSFWEWLRTSWVHFRGLLDDEGKLELRKLVRPKAKALESVLSPVKGRACVSKVELDRYIRGHENAEGSSGPSSGPSEQEEWKDKWVELMQTCSSKRIHVLRTPKFLLNARIIKGGDKILDTTESEEDD